MKRLCRILFSRYTISAIMIILEVLLLSLVVLMFSEFSLIFFTSAIIIDFIVFVIIVNADANPEYKVSWMAIITALPILGALLFVLFYRRRMTKKEIRICKEIHKKLNTDGRECQDFAKLASLDAKASGQAMAIMNDDPYAMVYASTEARYFGDGGEMYDAMCRDLATAETFIFLEYFIIKDGEMWRGILNILKEKVKAGVKVKLLYDDIGCMKSMTDDMLSEIHRAGILCRAFARVTPNLSTVHNNRDHRKMCVIDGKIAYTGGINIADEYINKEIRFGHWKDGGVRLFGAAARGFVNLYLQNWCFNIKSTKSIAEYIPTYPSENISAGDYFIPFGSGPAPIYSRSVGKAVFINIINQAERYVYITTPYLIIDFDLTEAIRGAAIRGVDVRIITPAIPDKKLVKIMTKSSYPYLINAGVEIYEYTPGFIHEKLMISDDIYTVSGSINLDYRSLAHHFECGVWMYSKSVANSAKENFMETISKSKKMDSTASKLTFSEWSLKNIMRFLAPLL